MNRDRWQSLKAPPFWRYYAPWSEILTAAGSVAVEGSRLIVEERASGRGAGGGPLKRIILECDPNVAGRIVGAECWRRRSLAGPIESNRDGNYSPWEQVESFEWSDWPANSTDVDIPRMALHRTIRNGSAATTRFAIRLTSLNQQLDEDAWTIPMSSDGWVVDSIRREQYVVRRFAREKLVFLGALALISLMLFIVGRLLGREPRGREAAHDSVDGATK